MTLIPLEQLPKHYAGLMEEVKLRVEAFAALHERAIDKASSRIGFAFMEGAYLQIRRICELIAQGVLVVHNQHPKSRSKDMMRAWNATDIFKALERLNKLAFPIATSPASEPGNLNDVVLENGGDFLDRAGFQRIYTSVSGKLHVRPPTRPAER